MDLKEIGNLLATQNGRATSWPIYVVEQRRRLYGLDPAYGGEVVWVDAWDYVEADEAEASELEAGYGESGTEPDGWIRTSFHDVWEFVSPFFTEVAAEAFIAVNRHRLNDPRVFVHSGYRNHEWQAVVTHLRAVAKDSAARSSES